MSRELRVNADELRIAADQLDMHAADLSHDHSTAHANMASAVPGFGATLSAAALNERIAKWPLGRPQLPAGNRKPLSTTPN